MQGERGHGTVFAAGVRGRLPRPQREGSFSGLADNCEWAWSTDPPQTVAIATCLACCASWPSSASRIWRRTIFGTCPPAVWVTPAGTCSRHPRRGHGLRVDERFFVTACVVCMLCVHSVVSTHVWGAAHPVLEQSRIEGACRGRDRRWNSGVRFTLPLRGHSPGPSGLGGVYCSKLLRANIFQSAAGQGSVRGIAGSFWRGACRGVVDTVLGCSCTGFCTSRSVTFEGLKGVREQGRGKTKTTRDVHRRRGRGLGG